MVKLWIFEVRPNDTSPSLWFCQYPTDGMNGESTEREDMNRDLRLRKNEKMLLS